MKHSLDDSVLLTQCAKIKAMIEKVASTPVFQEKYYASLYHHWKCSPVVQLEEIEEFEQSAGITLPEEYVYYLTQVSGGGAGPGTGLEDFSKLIYEPDTDETDLCEEEEEFEENQSGMICLCGMDLTYLAYLIVTGPDQGRIVYLDYNGDCDSIWPKGSPNFLCWVENFYSELLAGYCIDPTWKFMWQEPGDVQALIDAFQREENLQYRREVLYSFCKFETLTKEAYQFLESLRESEWSKEVEEILREKTDRQKKKSKETMQETDNVLLPLIEKNMEYIQWVCVHTESGESQIFSGEMLTPKQIAQLIDDTLNGQYIYLAADFLFQGEGIYVKRLKQKVYRPFHSTLVLHQGFGKMACLFFAGDSQVCYKLIGDFYAYCEIDTKDLLSVMVGEVMMVEYAVLQDRSEIDKALYSLFNNVEKADKYLKDSKNWSGQNIFPGGINNYNKLRRELGLLEN